jgi:peptidylprolyl isomerase
MAKLTIWQPVATKVAPMNRISIMPLMPLPRLHRAWLALALAVAVPAAGARAADDPNNEVVGRAGSAEIKLGQIREFLRHLDPTARQQAEKDPQALVPAIRNDLGRLAVYNEAQGKKWDQRPEVQAQLEQTRMNVVLTSYLQSVVVLPPGFPSDADVQAAYEANRGVLMKPSQFHLAQIFFSVPLSADKGVTDAVQRRAEEIDRKARGKGSDFAALARETSDHKESAVNGGDIGWVTADKLLPEIRNVVATMAKGEVSQPIRSPGGFNIVKLIELKPSELASLPEVRDGLIQTLRQRKFEELQTAYVNALLERNGVAINEMALRKAVAPGQ